MIEAGKRQNYLLCKAKGQQIGKSSESDDNSGSGFSMNEHDEDEMSDEDSHPMPDLPNVAVDQLPPADDISYASGGFSPMVGDEGSQKVVGV